MTENKVIELSDFETICRICLDKKKNMVSIFEYFLHSNLTKTYKEMIEECASVHVETDDLLPKKICLECLKYLEQTYKFKIQYLSAEKLLEEIVANEQSNIKLEVPIGEHDDSNHEDGSYFYNSDEISQNESIEKEFIVIKEESTKDIYEEINDNNANDYITNEELNENTNDYITVKTYNCEECELKFQSKTQYYKHQKKIHSDTVKCLFCDKIFENIEDVKKHSPELVCCKVCKQFYGCKDNLKYHVHKEHATCKICGKSFKNVQKCNRHIESHGNKRNLCTFCGKVFADTGNYNVHIRRHTGEKPFPCNQCDAKFADSTSLRKHYARHSNERHFECDICKSKFKTKDSLRKHQTTHVEENNYSCDICNKKFKSKRTLSGHQVVHTGERNHICSYCNKAFMKSDNLKMHLRIHTGEKPFVCSECGKKFSQKHVLNGHMKTHSTKHLRTSDT